MSGSQEGKNRRWRVEDDRHVGTPVDGGSAVLSITVSRDGKWVVSGTISGLVTVWNAESHSKVTEWKAHNNEVWAVDVSRDETIATGSKGRTLCIYSAPSNATTTWLRSRFHQMDASSSLPRGNTTLSWSTAVRTAVSSSSSQSQLARLYPSPGPAIASDYLSYLTTATSAVSTCPPGPLSRNGPFTVVTTQGASHWQATACSLQPPQVHQSHSGTLRRTSESGLSSSRLPCDWWRHDNHPFATP